MSEKIDIMHHWNEAGALHNPNDILQYAYVPYRACECGLALIVRVDRNLMILRVPIEKTKERMLCQPLQYFFNEGQWKVIFFLLLC
jgi:hypothetical protein